MPWVLLCLLYSFVQRISPDPNFSLEPKVGLVIEEFGPIAGEDVEKGDLDCADRC